MNQTPGSTRSKPGSQFFLVQIRKPSPYAPYAAYTKDIRFEIIRLNQAFTMVVRGSTWRARAKKYKSLILTNEIGKMQIQNAAALANAAYYRVFNKNIPRINAEFFEISEEGRKKLEIQRLFK